MLITLAYPHPELGEPDETVKVDAATGRQLVHDGLARLADDDALDGLTVPELQAYAEDHGIDLAGATKKADIAAAIRSAEKALIPPQPPITPVTGTNEQET